jgi:RNA polymerase sigma-70 factor (ECF subfamily)
VTGRADKELNATVIAKAQFGDRAAMNHILNAIQHALREHILTIVGDDATADDIAQDTLIIISRKLGQLRDPGWFKAWSYRIATREAVRRVSRVRRVLEEPVSDQLDLVQPQHEERFDAELVNSIGGMLERISPAARVVLRMHYIEEMSIVEVAEALELSAGTVKSRLAYGLSTLRKVMAGQSIEPARS